jgi:hypothetical protein
LRLDALVFYHVVAPLVEQRSEPRTRDAVVVSNTAQAIQWDYDIHQAASFDAVTATWIHFLMTFHPEYGTMYMDGQAINPGAELSAFGNGMPWGMPNLAGKTAGFMSAFSEACTNIPYAPVSGFTRVRK